MQLVVIGEPQQHHQLIFNTVRREASSCLQKRHFLNLETPILTQQDLRQSLLNKKIEPVNNIGLDTGEGLAIVVFVSFIINSAIWVIIPTLVYRDPEEYFFTLCDRRFSYMNDTATGQEGRKSLYYPCFFDNRWYTVLSSKDYSAIPLITLGVMWGVILTGIASKCIFKKLNFNKETLETTKRDEQIDAVLNNLAFMSHETEEASTKDIASSYQFLIDDELFLLNFAQLNKARKNNNQLFQEHLEGSKFSKQQLCIFRLFNHLNNADTQKKEAILDQKYSKEIIGSDPRFFQKVVRCFKPLNEKTSKTLSEILARYILKEESAAELTESELCNIIGKISLGEKLSHLLQIKLKGIEPSNENEDRFTHFLNTGKLAIESIEDCFKWIQLALERDNPEVVKWLENYLEQDLSKFIYHPELSLFLEKIDELNLESLKLKIDLAMEAKWMESLEKHTFELLERRVLFAKQHELQMCIRKAKEDFQSFVENSRINIPLNAKNVSRRIIEHLPMFERVFEDEKDVLVTILWNNIQEFLNQHPEHIEELSNVAKEDNNEWLIALIKNAYNKNKDLFDMHWLSPFDDNELNEVVVNKM